MFTVLLSWGVRESTMINNIFTVVNLLTVATVVITGLFKGNMIMIYYGLKQNVGSVSMYLLYHILKVTILYTFILPIRISSTKLSCLARTNNWSSIVFKIASLNDKTSYFFI